MDNIFKKLAAARVDLQNAGLSKSGYNNFLRFKYFELSDFLPEVNRLGLKYGFYTRFSVSQKEARLDIINTEKPEESTVFSVDIAETLQAQRAFCEAIVSTTCKKAEARSWKDDKDLKPLNVSIIQELGKNITYLRRYLLLIAFEICECDMIDASGNDADAPAQAQAQAQAQHKKAARQAAPAKPAAKPAAKPEPAKPAAKPEPEPFSKPILRKLWKDALDFGYKNGEIEEIIEKKASELTTEADYSEAVKKLEYRLALDDFTAITEAELPSE